MNRLRKGDDSSAPEKEKQEHLVKGPEKASVLFEAGKQLFGKVGGLLGKSDEKELAMRDQDYKILERDLANLEMAMPERKDILNKVQLMVKDNIRLKEMLAESNRIDSTAGQLENLLLAQVLEYERDTLEARRQPSAQVARVSPQSRPSSSLNVVDERRLV